MITSISVGFTTDTKPLAHLIWEKTVARLVLGWFLYVELWFHE